MLSEMLKPLRNLLMLSIILFILLLFNVSNKYYSNTFKITVNNQDIYVQYYERYKRGLIPLIFGTFNSKELSNDVTPIVNNVEFTKPFKLSIKEYEVYWKKHEDRAYKNPTWNFYDNFKYKETFSKANIVIKRKNKVLYNGKYIEDISDYVNEKGRYFFNVTVTRKDNFYSTVITHISFNIIVGGGQYEEKSY